MGVQSLARGKVSECWGVYDNGVDIDPTFSFGSYKTQLRLIVQIESEGITENVKNWRTDVVSSLTAALPVDKLMFEAAEPAVFA